MQPKSANIYAFSYIHTNYKIPINSILQAIENFNQQSIQHTLVEHQMQQAS